MERRDPEEHERTGIAVEQPCFPTDRPAGWLAGWLLTCLPASTFTHLASISLNHAVPTKTTTRSRPSERRTGTRAFPRTTAYDRDFGCFFTLFLTRPNDCSEFIQEYFSFRGDDCSFHILQRDEGVTVSTGDFTEDYQRGPLTFDRCFDS